MKNFHKPIRVNDVTVFDPFMGSGATIGEAAKLGAKAWRQSDRSRHRRGRSLSCQERVGASRPRIRAAHVWRDRARCGRNNAQPLQDDPAGRNAGGRPVLLLGQAGGVPGMRDPGRSVFAANICEARIPEQAPPGKGSLSALQRGEFNTLRCRAGKVFELRCRVRPAARSRQRSTRDLSWLRSQFLDRKDASPGLF